jgi:hypothetical protein
MLQRFNFALFSKGPPVTNHESLGGQRGGERGGFHPARCHFLLGAASAKTFLSNPRGKEKVRFLRWRLPLLLQSAAKEERAEPRHLNG